MNHGRHWIAQSLVILTALAAASAAPAAGTGKLVQLDGLAGCTSDTGSAGECTDASLPLLFTDHAVLSRDGKSFYVTVDLDENTGNDSNLLVGFARDKKSGALTELSGAGACISHDGTGGACQVGRGFKNLQAPATTADGLHIYVAGADSSLGTDGVITLIARDRSTGAINQLPGSDGCITLTGGVCATARAVAGPRGIVVSPDGRNVYVASSVSDAVAVFARSRVTGILTQLAGTAGCVSETGSGGCADGRALDQADTVAISPDGKFVYVGAAASRTVAVFARDKSTGALTQLAGSDGCISETGSGGACADGSLVGSAALTVTADGKSVYATITGQSAIGVFARNKKTGVLTQPAGLAACISEDGSGGLCADGKGMVGMTTLAVSKDGRNVYGAGFGGVAVMSRDKTTGGLERLPFTDACVSEAGSLGDCADGRGLGGPFFVGVSGDGKHVYTASHTGDGVAAFLRK